MGAFGFPEVTDPRVDTLSESVENAACLLSPLFHVSVKDLFRVDRELAKALQVRSNVVQRGAEFVGPARGHHRNDSAAHPECVRFREGLPKVCVLNQDGRLELIPSWRAFAP